MDLLTKILSMDKRQKFIYSLVYYNKKEPFFKTELEKYAGYNYPQQDLRKVIEFLIENKILIIFDKIHGDYRYKINKRLLERLIRKCPLFIYNGKFIEHTKPTTYNY